MKRMAIGAFCALVALNTAALGLGFYTWRWHQLSDFVYDNTYGKRDTSHIN